MSEAKRALEARVLRRVRKAPELFTCSMSITSNFYSATPGKGVSLNWLRWLMSLSRGEPVEVASRSGYYCRFVRRHKTRPLVLIEWLGADGDFAFHRSFVNEREVSMTEDDHV